MQVSIENDPLCNNSLKSSYQIIGLALLELEKFAALNRYFIHESPRALQVDLALISNEVIESYIEDLLDFEISDERLYIFRKNIDRVYSLSALLGLLISLAIGLKLAQSGVSLVLSLSAVLLITLPCGMVWHLAPKLAPNRRLYFAKLLELEMERRIGGPYAKARQRLLNSNLRRASGGLISPSKISLH